MEYLVSDDKAMAKHWDESRQELYEWMNNTATEWHELKIVDDKQYIALLMLLHEVDKIVYYDFKGD